ncbi:TrbC family F-type conjugative pilus assembly protein (plasmid) [Escherichia coli]
MVNGDMRATANAVAGLVKESNTGGVQIDPTTFRKYNITAVPVLIVACGNQGDTVDRLQGDLTLHQALKRVAEEGTALTRPGTCWVGRCNETLSSSTDGDDIVLSGRAACRQ